MGPPGVGKGTQAKIISNYLQILHISTGEILRSEINKRTKVGDIAKSFIDIGKLVPDNIILDIVTNTIRNHEGYLLDGFPRTIPQAIGLDNILSKSGHFLNMAINLIADEDELLNRIIKRGKYSKRSDDISNIIKERQTIYWEQTAPLIQYYEKKNILQNINGVGTIEDITQKILKIIN